MIALMLTIELLSFAPTSQRAIGIFRALSASAPASVQVRPTTTFEGHSDVLMLWGPGAPDRLEPMAQQIARGGHVLALDLAYWDRDNKFRVSIDAAHPQAWVMRREWPADRVRVAQIRLADAWIPTGPVVVAGIGRKARVQYGDDVDAWERRMMTAAAQRWPGRRVFYRRKQNDAPVPSGAAVMSSARPIDEALAGASLVITWHSNVAVDAIRLGIPVICHDGAAAAVCPGDFGDDDPRPLTPDLRDRFLRNLAWFQWSGAEADGFWAWVPKVLG